MDLIDKNEYLNCFIDSVTNTDGLCIEPLLFFVRKKANSEKIKKISEHLNIDVCYLGKYIDVVNNKRDKKLKFSNEDIKKYFISLIDTKDFLFDIINDTIKETNCSMHLLCEIVGINIYSQFYQHKISQRIIKKISDHMNIDIEKLKKLGDDNSQISLETTTSKNSNIPILVHDVSEERIFIDFFRQMTNDQKLKLMSDMYNLLFYQTIKK